MTGFLFKNTFLSRVALLLLGVGCCLAAYFIAADRGVDIDSLAKRFEYTLHEKEQYAKHELDELDQKAASWSYEKVFSEKPHYYETLFENEGLVFLIFENDTLRFWTDNTVSVNQRLAANNFSGKIARLPNGWFGIERLEKGNKKLYALILLKRQYSYQNKYLTNEFTDEFGLSKEVEIVIDRQKELAGNKATADPGDVFEKKGDYLCTLAFPASGTGADDLSWPALLLMLSGFVFILWALQWEVDSLKDKVGRGWAALLLALAVVALRHLMVLTDFPQLFYTTPLFDPQLYGDAAYSWLSSLGDLLINVVLLFFLSFYTYRNCSVGVPGKNVQGLLLPFSGNAARWFGLSLLLLILLSSNFVNYVFSGLISNSNIPFTLNDVFGQNGYTVLALVVVGLFFISYFFLLDRITDLMLLLFPEPRKLLQYSALCTAVFVVADHLLGTLDLIQVFWPVVLFVVIAWSKIKRTDYSFSVIVVLLVVVSFFSAHISLKYSDRRELGARQLFAEKLAAEQDPLAEHLFAEVEPLLATDSALVKMLHHPTADDDSPHPLPADKAQQFTRTVLSKYFSGYWEKYEIRLSAFDTACFPLVQGSLPDRDNLNYFEETIDSAGRAAGSRRFYYLPSSSGRLSYLAHVPMMNGPGRVADLFIEMDSRIVSEEVGFPELMLDRKLGIANELQDYSYAKYKNGRLMAYHGKFPYSLHDGIYKQQFTNDSSRSFSGTILWDHDGFNHLVYSQGESIVVISKKEERLSETVTTFSYLFAFFSLVLLALLFLRFLAYERRIQVDSFRSRIQYVLVSMVLFSLLSFGAGTIYYIKQQYERQTKQSVRDKMLSSLVEGMQELGEESELKPTKADYFSYVLRRMSSIFLTDISLYDKEGNLAGSSQMKLFDEGLMSRKMSPESYYRLAILQSIEHIQDERIGNLEYLSAYCSFRNNEGELLGYLNIPYFARQSDLEKEISVILSAIINIYVLLFVISVILALAISAYFTKPLRLIQEKLSNIKLGKANEPIEWKSDDEIGSLVNEYNRMIEELQKSAELLARSERETAWREMAKQVAHEIKNPLTPMKLSIQHLQRTWKNQDDDRDKKIERITATMIEQIETLSTIASEFSSFAKMPAGVTENVDVKTILENCVALFRDSTDTEFVFNCSMESAVVRADKEQMLRVFNNLIKNALQAIPENRQGKIEVSILRKDGSFLIKIKDNGTGIAEDKMSKIFTPNFTTKTGGMGLGLAMVKSIIETFGGKIWFETSRDNGTSFFVSLPEFNE